MLSGDTIVEVRGFGEVDYPNIPTFLGTTTLDKSKSVIEEYLRTQKRYVHDFYLFSVNLPKSLEFVYSYLNGEVKISSKYEGLEIK